MDPQATETALTSSTPVAPAATGEQPPAIPAAAAAPTAGTQDTTSAQKPSEGAKTEGAEGKPGEAAKEDAKLTGAPETYEAFTMPEGFQLDEQLLGEFTPTLKELNLSQEAAQKLMDFAPKLVEKTVQQTRAAVLEQVGMTDAATWPQAVQADKEIGGDKLAENLAVAQKAMNAFATPELRAVLNKTGLGNHPELIRAFVKVGKSISEDSFVPGGRATTPQSPATRIYSASNMNP